MRKNNLFGGKILIFSIIFILILSIFSITSQATMRNETISSMVGRDTQEPTNNDLRPIRNIDPEENQDDQKPDTNGEDDEGSGESGGKGKGDDEKGDGDEPQDESGDGPTLGDDGKGEENEGSGDGEGGPGLGDTGEGGETDDPSENPPIIGGGSQPPEEDNTPPPETPGGGDTPPTTDNEPPANNNPSNSNNGNSNQNQETNQNNQETEINENIIPAGKTYEFTPNNHKTTGFYKVKLEPTVDLHEPALNINKVEELTEEIPEYSGEYNVVLKYIDIKITSNGGEYLTEEKISNLSFNFELETSEVLEKNINLSEIKLARYHNGWTELETEIIEINKEKICFEAKTPGLSTFAVVGKTVQEIDISSQISGSKIPEMPWFVIIGITISGIICLLIFIIKSKGIYIEKETIKEEIKKDKALPFEY